MANSKRKVLINYLRDTLLPTITTGGGYNNTVKLVERGIQPYENLTDDQFPALFLVAPDEDRRNITVKPDFQSDLNLVIVGYVKDADGSPGKAQEAVDDLIEDLTKALYVDVKQGGRCHETEIGRITADSGDLGTYAGFVLEVRFMYTADGTTP